MIVWHQDGNGGYVGEDDNRDADAKVTPLQLDRHLRNWRVVTRLYGQVIDDSCHTRLRDAKWHANAVISEAVTTGGTLVREDGGTVERGAFARSLSTVTIEGL